MAGTIFVYLTTHSKIEFNSLPTLYQILYSANIRKNLQGAKYTCANLHYLHLLN